MVVLYSWFIFLNTNNKSLWSDWNFSEVSSRGSFYTIFHNLFTLNLFNKYAFQQWLQLFFLNFNWIYWLISIVGISVLFKKGKHIVLKYYNYKKVVTVIVVFIFSYSFTVLSFQTFTIPRYHLPLIPFLYLAASVSIVYIPKTLNFSRIYFDLIFVALILSTLFVSIDPISARLWGKTKVLGEELYSLNNHLAGNDGITYNMQYAFIAKKRTQKILTSNILSEDCYWLFADPNNDTKTFRILNINENVMKSCK